MKFLEGLVVAVVSTAVGVVVGSKNKEIMSAVHDVHVSVDKVVTTGTGMVNDVTHAAHVFLDEKVEEFKAGYKEGKDEHYTEQRKAELNAKVDEALKIKDEATRVAAINAILAEVFAGK